MKSIMWLAALIASMSVFESNASEVAQWIEALPEQAEVFAISTEIENNGMESVDPSSLIPIGRTIQNKSGGKLEFVCLEKKSSQKICPRFQLRENGNVLVGVIFQLHRYPVTELKAIAKEKSREFYKERKWKFLKVPLIGKLIFPKGDDAHLPWVIDFSIGWVAGCIYGASTDGAFYLMFVGAGAFVGADVILAGMTVLVPLVQRTLNRVQWARADRRLSRAIEDIFNPEKINSKPLSLRDRNFRLFKKMVKEASGANRGQD